MIEVKDLYLKYIREYYALYNINLKVQEGECVALTGLKHSGRTTLLRAIAGLEKYDKGEIFINGREVRNIDFSTDIELGYVPATPVFFENKTVYENLKYVLQERKINKNDIELKINQVLIDFKIEKYKDIKIQDLDLYEKYLISFVRLSMRNLKVLLVDDIFDNLNEEESNAFVNLIKDLFLSKNVTTILVCDNYNKVKDICSREIHFTSGSID
ncbi:MAG: ATP-binding cassette domain-containing protein [Eubacteriales bacterium]|nr:ATP-binding cassette domain-containing protein [Eubacteriales bacterium]